MKSAPGQPAIGGRPVDSLFSMLQDYRHLRRINPAMQVLLFGMSDRDVADVAEYFSLSGKAPDTVSVK
jgi:cytochrome c553